MHGVGEHQVITVQVTLELTPEQLDKLTGRIGRENPHKPWTDRERKQYVREWVQSQVDNYLAISSYLT